MSGYENDPSSSPTGSPSMSSADISIPKRSVNISSGIGNSIPKELPPRSLGPISSIGSSVTKPAPTKFTLGVLTTVRGLPLLIDIVALVTF